MADPSDPKTLAMKTRITTHMTNDHGDSLALYLRHYAHLPASTISNPALTDITLDHMIITSSHGRTLIPFEPPLNSLAETRERVVKMHQTCLTALDLSAIKIDEFVPPSKVWQWLTHAICVLCFTTLSPWLAGRIYPTTQPGGVVNKIWNVGGVVPGLAGVAGRWAAATWWFMVVVHAGEAAWMAQGRLRRHWITIGSGVWWAWVLATFNGGVASISRFDEAVAMKKAEQERKAAAGNH